MIKEVAILDESIPILFCIAKMLIRPYIYKNVIYLHKYI